MSQSPLSPFIASPLTANHLCSIDDLSDQDIERITSLALDYAAKLKNKTPIHKLLAGRTQINLFFEDSTRTSLSFELAGKKLGADIINLPVSASSINKNEETLDTVQTLAAMGTDAMVIRSNQPDLHQTLTEKIDCAIINAGDGTKEHPSQALLDVVTIMSERKTLEGCTIAICGDILHSRVAGSNARLLIRLGAEVRFVGPQQLLPKQDQFPHIGFFTSLKEGLDGCDIVYALRIQFERLSPHMRQIMDTDKNIYLSTYGLTHKTMGYAKPDAKIMHPGPMNRGIEIDGALADDPQKSLILHQVFNGVPTRMAILEGLICSRNHHQTRVIRQTAN